MRPRLQHVNMCELEENAFFSEVVLDSAQGAEPTLPPLGEKDTAGVSLASLA